MRKTPPALYNPARLYEQPIPYNGDVSPNSSFELDFESDDQSASESFEQQEELEEQAISIENNNFTVDNDDAEPINDPLEIEVKEESFIEITEEDRAALYLIVNDLNANNDYSDADAEDDSAADGDAHANSSSANVDEGENDNVNVDEPKNTSNMSGDDHNDSDSDVEEVWVDSAIGYPKPQQFITLSGLTKQENDSISGKLPYATKVKYCQLKNMSYFVFMCINFILFGQKNGSRVYEVGGRRFIIAKAILQKIRAWSTLPFVKNIKYDMNIVHLLLILIVGTAGASKKIDADVEQFVRGMTFFI